MLKSRFFCKIPKNKKVKYKYIIKNGNPSDKNAHYYFTIPKKMINFNLSIGYSYLKFSIIS